MRKRNNHKNLTKNNNIRGTADLAIIFLTILRRPKRWEGRFTEKIEQREVSQIANGRDGKKEWFT